MQRPHVIDNGPPQFSESEDEIRGGQFVGVCDDDPRNDLADMRRQRGHV